MQGRLTASHGAAMARQYIRSRYQQIRLRSFASDEPYFQPFTHSKGWSDIVGTNVLGWHEGRQHKQRFIVVSAHYDHLGKRAGHIFNGADDNASGVAAMLSLAQYIAEHGSQYSIIFVATDAEEKGLYGAKAFVASPPVPLAAIWVNLNLDMLAEGGRRKRLYVTSSKALPALIHLVESAISGAGLCLVKGHRSHRGNVAGRGHINWRQASDHAAFAAKKIPYLFLGVSNHSRHHNQNDNSEKIDQNFLPAPQKPPCHCY